MRILRSPLPLASVLLALSAPLALAQDPKPAEPAAPAAAARPDQPAPEGPPRRRRPALVFEAGTVHPASGPAIENGVVVVRGERIVAVGKKGEVEIPENATVRSFPTGHLYPGLVDAATDAFTDNLLRSDQSLDAGAALADDLRLRGDRQDGLVQAGITTAYVTVRSPAQWRGLGAIVRPRAGGFDLWPGHERAGLQMRLTNGPVPSHPLQRQQQLDGAAGTFDGLEDHRKAKTDHQEALKKYEKEFADYLAFHQKKKDAEKPKEEKPKDAPKEGDKPATPPAAPENQPAPGGNPPGGERRRRPGGNPPGGGAADEEFEQALESALAAIAQDPPKPEPPKQDPPKQEPKPAPAPQGQGAPGGEKPPEKAEKKDEGPKRPTYPKPPAKDPAKDNLLRVVDGEIALRVEAHRPDELRAALRLQQKNSIPLLVLEQAYGAAGLAGEIAAQGAFVVLTEVLPNSMPKPYEAFDPVALPALLHAEGVPFAIASGSAARASILPLMAAAAVARGLDRDAALRAITLWPAQVLGVAVDTGSLEPGKFADLLVCDRPLFASDCRVLFVLAKGRTEFEVQ
ncbi:MAG: amidohydrolase family protein [Planctomycetes bacterium]|nr:amidohydrolase family protein [Planctomycetota bacterium]